MVRVDQVCAFEVVTQTVDFACSSMLLAFVIRVLFACSDVAA